MRLYTGLSLVLLNKHKNLTHVVHRVSLIHIGQYLLSICTVLQVEWT